MKAIIITFDGDIKDENTLVSECMKIVHKSTNARETSVSLLLDKEIAEMLIKQIATSRTNPELKAIQNLCSKIIEKVGPIPLRTIETAKREICRFLVSQNIETVRTMVTATAKVDTTSQYEKHREILQNFGLMFLPQLLRDVNPVFRFY